MATPRITKQKDFIEATSRLSTFAIPSPTGSGTITPLEIRTCESKLDLIRSVLTTSANAFQHPDLLLSLSDKLGYKGDTGARIEVLGMLVDSAIKGGEVDVAWTHCQEMLALSKRRTKFDPKGKPVPSSQLAHPQDVIWKSCLLIGSRDDSADVEMKMNALGQAVERCPAEEMPHVLEVWRKIESGRMKLDEAAKRRRVAGIKASVRDGKVSSRSAAGSSVASPMIGEERMLGSRTAARAARLAMDFAGNRLRTGGISPHLPSGIGSLSFSPCTPASAASSDAGTESRRSGESDRPSIGAMFDGSGVGIGQGAVEAERVRQQARRALVRGVGWLLGAEDEEMGSAN